MRQASSRVEEFSEYLRAEERVRRHTQTTFPWMTPVVSPPRGPLSVAAERAKARALRELMLEDAVTELTILVDSIADDERRPCRCLNAASCLCVASGIVREYRATAKRQRDVLMGISSPLPANSHNGGDDA